jgi:hypothetical protein
MDFQKKGWLKRYLYLRNNYALMKEYDRLVNLDKKSFTPEKLLYDLLQPSGLLYGLPANIPIHYKSLLRALRTEKLSNREKVKVILTESFLNSGLVSPRYHDINQKIDVADAQLESAINIGKFYQALYPDLLPSKKQGLFRRSPKGLELSEHMINTRVEQPAAKRKLWNDFFQSSLYFLDVVHFGRWLHLHKQNGSGDKILEQHRADRLLLFKVIVAAAYANKVVEPEEKKLLQNFLALARFDEETQKETSQLLAHGINMASLGLEQVDSLIMKRHLMELAILTVFADREINRDEEVFLEAFRKALKIKPVTFYSSEVAVGSFMLENWQHLAHQQDEEKLNQLGKKLLSRIYKLTCQDEDHFRASVENNKDLRKLLLKMNHEKLSTEDRNKIRQELFRVISALPSLVGIALPKNFLTFNRLMEIFPEAFLTTSQDQPPK